MLTGSLTAQESATPVPVLLDSITVQTDGLTQEWALRGALAEPLSGGKFAGLTEGQVFESAESLQASVDAHRQALVNRRVFKTVDLALTQTDNRAALKLTIQDSWTLIPFLLPKYDQNTGLRGVFRIMYPNALGTLTDFQLNTNADFDSAFKVQNWSAAATLASIKAFGLTWSASLTQNFGTETKLDSNDTVTFKSTSFSTAGSLSTGVPLPFGFGYGVSLSGTNSYGFEFPVLTNPADKTDTLAKKEGWVINPSHSLSWGALNWVGNLRRGYVLSAGNSYSWVLNQQQVHPNLTGSATWADTLIDDLLGLSVRLNGFWELDQDRLGAASDIRGVLDAKLYGNFGVFASLTATLSVLKIPGWFETQGNLFIDTGAAKKRFLGLQSTEFKYGVGGEVLVFPDFSKNLILRASVGIEPSTYSLKLWNKLSSYEIVLGTGLQY